MNGARSINELAGTARLVLEQKLLEKYVGRAVKVYRYNEATGREDEYEAEVLSVNQGALLRIGNEITFNLPGRFAFPEIPDNLIAKPTLVWLVDSRDRRQSVEVSYLSRNLSWKSDYVMVVNADDTRADLTAWVTLTNQRVLRTRTQDSSSSSATCSG